MIASHTKKELAEALCKGLYTNTGYRFDSRAVQGQFAELVKNRKDNLVAMVESSVLAQSYLFGRIEYNPISTVVEVN